MSAQRNHYTQEIADRDLFAHDAAVEVRATFLRMTYLHLAMAVMAFIGLTSVLVNTPPVVDFMFGFLQRGQWWLVLGAFMLVGWLAERWAYSGASKATQYAGLGLYVVCESLIFVPLLYYVQFILKDPDIIWQAGCLSIITFGSLTAIVMLTGADFGFMRTFLWVATLVAIGFMIFGAIFGFSLGIVFISAMMLLMSGYILYHTSEILHRYPPDQYVGASLALFASLATLFWYIIQFLMSLQRD